MSLMLKVGIFILFIITYAIYTYIVNYLSRKHFMSILKYGNFWVSLVFIGFFFTSLYLLSGFFSLPLIILFTGVYILSNLIFIILLGLSGISIDKYIQRALWAIYVAVKTPIVAICFLIAVFFGIMYPLIAGYFYFTHSANSIELTILIFKLNVIIFMIIGLPFGIGIQTNILVSKDLDEESRKYVFVGAIAGLIPLILLFTLTFLGFRVAEFSVSHLPLIFLIQLPIILIGIFFIFVLLPYIIGFQRAKKYHLLLIDKQIDWYDKLLDILDFPTHQLYATKLNQFHTNLHDEINTFSSEDKEISLFIQIDQDLIPEELQYSQQIVQAYRESRDLDLRFKYLDGINLLREQVEEIIQDLAEKENEEKREKAANVWAETYHSRKNKLFKEIENTKQTKSIGLAVIVAIIAPVASVILAELGKLIWSIFLQSLTQ